MDPPASISGVAGATGACHHADSKIFNWLKNIMTTPSQKFTCIPIFVFNYSCSLIVLIHKCTSFYIA
jgi:hypothetical protein